MLVCGVVLGLIQAFAQRIFRHILQIGIDRCVNAETFVHGAIPPDCGDNLLADVIDRVGLTLRILPAADVQIFPLRAGAFLAVYQPEITHAAESVVSCLARPGAVAPR